MKKSLHSVLVVLFVLLLGHLNLQAKENDFSQILKQNVSNDIYPSFKYRAWGMGGDSVYSKANVVIGKEHYFVLAFNQDEIKQFDASTAGDVTTIMATLSDGDLSQKMRLVVSQDYLDKAIVLKVFDEEDRLISQSDIIYLQESGTYIDAGTLTIK